ncbi:MAG TPA: carboxylating nicotinate-nucleotide diphosphorylase [Steroidobacteraceae bacterium]
MADSLPADLPEQVSRALREDIGSGDVTAGLLAERSTVRASVICREPAVLCGRAWFDESFRQLDPRITVHWLLDEGADIAPSTTVCELSGSARALLSGERTALNFLQLLSGTATIARRYVAAVAGTGCRVLDTRKTIPGLRTAQKYAVRCGGASNHRLGLFDQVLIKENHIAAAGSVAAAVRAARTQQPQLRIEVETENLAEFEQALVAGADIIMLDDFALEDVRRAVERNRAHQPSALLEVSGGVDLKRIRPFAETGVDFISVGALTKHVKAIDLSLRVD